MTWFRVGGAGIPASLKNAMNAVFNKKFGTSGQNYPPNGWPDNVNLLGPLPEKTASGAIAHIEDGADGVPLKNWLVTLPASLDGVSSVGVVSAGKNLVNIPDSAEITRNQLIANVVPLLDDFLNGKKGNYTISAKTAETVENANFITIRINYTDGTSSSNVYIYRGSTNESGGITGTFSISSNPTKTINGVYFGGNTGAAKCAVSEWQIEANAQATAYAPYVTPTTHTATLGRTIYGGEVDIVNGEGKETYTRVKISDLSWDVQTVSGRSAFVSGKVTGLPTTSPKNVLCDVLTYDGEKTIGAMTDKTLVTWTNTFRVYDTDCEDVTEFLSTYGNGYIVYQLNDSAPTDFTFTPITPTPETALGVNNFWADEGDSDVTYRADISLALQALGGGGRGLMGMMMQRPEEEQLTEEDPEEVSELEENNQNTEEQEGENDER